MIENLVEYEAAQEELRDIYPTFESAAKAKEQFL